MPILNFSEAMTSAMSAVEGLDLLEFKAPVGGGHEPEVEVLRGPKKGLTSLSFSDVPLNLKGTKSLCGLLDIPASFLTDKDHEFQAYVLNHCAKKYNLCENTRAVVKDGMIQQWIRKDKVVVSDTRILEAVSDAVEALGSMAMIDLSKSYFGLDRSSYAVYFSDEEYEHLVEADDILYPGFRMSNSILGDGKPELNFYIFRKVCSNGLMRPVLDFQESLILKDSDYPVRVTEFLIEHTDRAFHEAVEFSRLREIPVDDPNKAVFSLAQQLKLSTAKRDGLLYLMDAEAHPENMYDLVNLLTSFANYQTPKNAINLQYAAGRSVDFLRTSATCSSCHSIVPFGLSHDEDTHETETFESEAIGVDAEESIDA